jgi:anthranilate phosphoribosyltransferase
LPNPVITKAIDALAARRDLTTEQTAEVLAEIMDGNASEVETAGVLIALRTKGETVEEIEGLAQTMRRFATPVETGRDDLVDTAGTGGDGAGTFNISTAAALVAAAAGAAVAKHGNRAVSSSSGSADVLEALGFELELPPDRVAASIDELGFGFLFAPTHHPAMRHAAPVRRELAARTVFNVLGPLTNPAGARAQVVGVYAPELVPTIAAVLAQLGARRAFVVHGAGGIDELSPAGANLVCEVAGGKVRRREIDPRDFGVPRCRTRDLAGGSPEENAATIREILAGAAGPKREAVLLNAGGAVAAGGHARDLKDGYRIAAEAVDSGLAAARLDELIAFSRAKEVAA